MPFFSSQAAGGTRMVITGSLAGLMTCSMYLVRARDHFPFSLALLSWQLPAKAFQKSQDVLWNEAFSSNPKFWSRVMVNTGMCLEEGNWEACHVRNE